MAKADLNGKVVAITGGARGIGRCTAEALIRKGAKVAIGDLDGDLARTTASELGSGTQAFDVNVTERSSFDTFADEVEAAMGPIDVLINNAGIMPLGALIDESDETAQRQIDINLHGVIFGTKIALKRFVPRNSGHIVNIASMAGKGGFPHAATYCATKHAVVGLSEAVRGELNETEVRISVVMPAIVNTELTSGLQSARGIGNIEPEDVADAIVDALEKDRFEVFVPKSAGRIGRVMQLMPRRGREAVARALKADRVLTEIDHDRRAAYEDRAAHSDPGVEPEAAEREKVVA
jgi:NAD(P)-dependent dehydrogenase (short-subunit alcohol dehydrogenase family)